MQAKHFQPTRPLRDRTPRDYYQDDSINMHSMQPPPAQYPVETPDRSGHPQRNFGSHFKDGIRRVDYVLIYEKEADRKKTIGEGLSRAAAKVVKKTKKQLKRERRRSQIERQKGPAQARIQYYLSNLVDAGLDLELEDHKDDDEEVTVVKLHATWDALCREAETLRMKMPLRIKDPYTDAAKESCWERFVNFKIFGRSDDDVPPGAGPHIYWRFDRDHLERFLIPTDRDEFFSVIQRSEIVWEIMQDCRNDPHRKDSRGVESLLEDEVIECAYPLHHGDYHIPNKTPPSSYSFRQKLNAGWAAAWVIFKPQPLNRIRNYFGEKTGFYFAYMQFYTLSLIVPSLFGLAAFLYGLISVATTVKPVIDDICNEHGEVGNFDMCPTCQPPVCEPFKMYEEGCLRSKWQYRLDNEATLIVSILTIFWCALFIKFWRRQQARLAFNWQTFDMYELPGQIRPDYEERAKKEERIDPVTGVMEPHIPTAKRAPWIAASVGITILLLVAVGASLVGLIAARIGMYEGFRKLGGIMKKKNVEASRWTAHFLMWVMVTLFEKIYHAIVERLTVWECWKTDLQFMSSLLWKLFILSELVDFLPIAYAAFFKGRSVRTPINLSSLTETCEPGGCMGEVVELVAVLLIARLVVGNLIEFIVPTVRGVVIRRREKARMKQSGHPSGWPQWLKDYQLDTMQLDGVSKELMEMMIQLSFVVFFVPALTLAPLLCFINNIIEIRVDAMNFLASHRRKTPQRVPHFETWNTFLDIILKVGVLVNAGLIAFTSEIVPRLFYKYQSRESNLTFVGYPKFSMSRLNVSHWPELQAVIDEAKENVKRYASEASAGVKNVAANVTSGHHGRFLREVAEAVAGEVGKKKKKELEEEEYLAGLTECRYFDYRKLDWPYEKTIRYWQVISYRIAAFALFAIGFYVIIYLINHLIKDVPPSIEKKIKRHQYIVTKLLEEQDNAKINRLGSGRNSQGGPTAASTRPAPANVVRAGREAAYNRHRPGDNAYEPVGGDYGGYGPNGERPLRQRPGARSDNGGMVNRVYVHDNDV